MGGIRWVWEEFGGYGVDGSAGSFHGDVLDRSSSAPGGGSEIDVKLAGLDPAAVWLTIWKGSTQQVVKVSLEFDASRGGIHTLLNGSRGSLLGRWTEWRF